MKTPILLLLFLISCASRYELNVTKISEREGIALINGKIGDRLKLQRLICIENDPLADMRNSCSYQEQGEVIIVEVLNDKQVRFKADIVLEAGDKITPKI